MDNDSFDALLPSMAVRKFPSIKTAYGPYTANRIAFIECPKCFAMDNFFSLKKRRKFSSQYCEGNQPPEVKCKTPLGEHTHICNCAGVTEQHLHVYCNVCQFISLWALPEEKNG